MGAGNVVKVVTGWPPYLNDKAFRALVVMSVIALDDDHPPRYFGGWAPVARAIGVPFPDACELKKHEGDPRGSDRCSECKTAQHNAGQAVSLLLKVGAIELLKAPMKSRRAEYALRLDQLPLPTEKIKRKAGPKKPSATTVVAHVRYDGGSAHALSPSSPVRYDGDSAEEEVKRRLGIETGKKSPQAGTSPGADLGFADASKILHQLPDLGGALLAVVDGYPEPPQGMEARIIAAAQLAVRNRTGLRPVAGDAL